MLTTLFQHLAAPLFVACPRRWRFPLAQRLARGVEPFYQWKGRFESYKPPLHGSRERAVLLFVLDLIRREIDFDPELDIQPAQLLPDHGGVLILTAHFSLNRLLLRWLYERGRQVSVITRLGTLEECVGRNYAIELIPSDARLYLHIREHVRAGRVVYLTMDTVEPIPNARQLKLGEDTVYVSHTALRFAERARIPVLFAVTRVSTRGKIIVNLARPSTTQAETAFTEFCQFLSAEVEQMHS